MSASAATIASRCGPTCGASQISVMSALAMRPPAARTIAAACSTKMRDGAPFHCGSDGGKCVPMSPAPQVASSASVSACSADIGVGMARQRLSCGMVIAAERHVVARLERVHVVAVAGAHIGKAGRAL